jgi:hypothetical protein
MKEVVVEQPSRGIKDLWEEQVTKLARKYPAQEQEVSEALDSHMKLCIVDFIRLDKSM